MISSFWGKHVPKLEVANLNTDRIIFSCCFDLSGVGLLTLAKCCPNLSKVMLHMRMNITDSVPISLMSLAPNLTHLGLCDNISDEALDATGSSNSISYLNLQKCKITEVELGFLANGSVSKTLRTLMLDRGFNIGDVGFNINDVVVSHLQKMHCLEHLNLSYCNAITDIGGVAISAIPTLKLLSLEGLCQVSDRTVVALAQNCPNMESLDLSYCGITGAGIRAFWGHPSVQTIVLQFCEVGADDLEHSVIGCRSLKYIHLNDNKLEEILPLMSRIEDFCYLNKYNMVVLLT